MAKKYLSVVDIEKSDDIQFAEVDAWGGTLRLGSLSAGDMIDFAEANEGPAKKTAGLRLIIKSLVDGEGNRIGDDKLLNVLRRKDSQTVSKIIDAVLKLNGLEKKAGEKTGNE